MVVLQPLKHLRLKKVLTNLFHWTYGRWECPYTAACMADSLLPGLKLKSPSKKKNQFSMKTLLFLLNLKLCW
jgi:hypothetical protein